MPRGGPARAGPPRGIQPIPYSPISPLPHFLISPSPPTIVEAAGRPGHFAPRRRVTDLEDPASRLEVMPRLVASPISRLRSGYPPGAAAAALLGLALALSGCSNNPYPAGEEH